jgi:hypothetical protein
MQEISVEEWNTLVHLKDEISKNCATIVPEDMELFTELFVRSLYGKGEYTQNLEPTNY